ncbi:hypothetical protein NEOLEDRAFT_1065705 [Neolentinus lepideus HHB14362 ss-1]|uniref:Class E vacuolar protein-sorting machinery protein HSE1 n=1 Tax=Neolentinus lepideus HHB14362 ss-1 TaxID=1314782 RepID=A0A165SIK3_9AGAM|nr:hypothetical protein NEOLEDRAFT_1065705 [Neolentinus lepideus HHB14362 ss-1]
MFKAGQSNPYDDIVVKTTDENLTSENWELILNLCDKVQDEGETGGRNVIAAVIKRLAHRNPNVQLYSLTLVESLQKNCGIAVHREISSRAFTQALEKLVTDRTTHDKVRRRTLSLIATWTAEFESDPTLGIMEDLYNSLKAKNYKFETPSEPPPPDVDDEIRRKEEEELQRALEMSVHDKGGRGQWAEYSAYSSGGAGGAGSSSSGPGYGAPSSTSTAGSSSAGPASSSSSTYRRDSYQQPAIPSYGSDYAPARRTQTPVAIASVTATASSVGPAPSTSPPAPSSQPIVTRVRALHTFEPSEQGELAFEKGDIIKVVDRGYKDWWRGQLKGRTGIFPVNYVEPLPEPTSAELAREAEQEAGVFYQAMNVDRLLTLLRHLDPAKDNLADNEEIQELYRQCMSLRPKIVKLIEKYSQKRADLISMNEGFIKARTIYERMMEESLARHTQGISSFFTFGAQQGMLTSCSSVRQLPPHLAISRFSECNSRWAGIRSASLRMEPVYVQPAWVQRVSYPCGAIHSRAGWWLPSSAAATATSSATAATSSAAATTSADISRGQCLCRTTTAQSLPATVRKCISRIVVRIWPLAE